MGEMMATCVYCGMPSYVMDHVIPKSHLKKLSQQRIDELNASGQIMLAPACIDCNNIAGDKVFESLPKKRAYVQLEIAKRYRSSLTNAETDNDKKNRLMILMRLRWGGSNDFDMNVSYDQLVRYLMTSARFDNALRPHTSFILNKPGHKSEEYGSANKR
jgi:hypothetical protein